MFRTSLVLIAMAYALPYATAQACGADLRGAQTLESGRYLVAYRMQPAKIVVGKHFSIDVVTCAKGDVSSPAGVAVDAYMPEHGHGMNYKATIKSTGKSRFRADGLMFHMPGRWDLSFDIQGAGGTERLTRSIVLE